MSTGNSLVSAALQGIGRLGSGDSATTQELSDGVDEMNRMLGKWNAETGAIYAEALDSVTWTANNASRTIGTGGDLNVTRPQTIIGAAYRDASNIDYALSLIPHREYQEITTKAITTTIPAYLAYNPTFTTGFGTLFIWPVPSADFTFRLNSLKAIADLTGAGTIAFPPGWEDAIVANLKPRFAQIYGLDVTPFMMQEAADTKAVIVQANIHPKLWKLDPLLPGQSSGYNPRAYWNI